MKVLHVVKTSDGAVWAVRQCAALTSLGVEVHVALPRLTGKAIAYWQNSGAVLHECDLDLPIWQPTKFPAVLARARQLIRKISPDLIHSHFVGTTLALRLALGKNHPVPRIFQVPGPLHLEHALYRRLELGLAGTADHWIGSSRCIVNHYASAGVSRERTFLSYYGDDLSGPVAGKRGILKLMAGALPREILVGNISWIYPPKFYLGQRRGVKAHEDLIEALGIVCRSDRRVRGVIAGAPWGEADWYARRLHSQARKAARSGIAFTGAIPLAEAKLAWHDLDLAVHVPISENCGGVVEPLLAGVPVIAGNVGGLPEVIFDGVTGRLVPPRTPKLLAATILQCLRERDHCHRMALRGQQLVKIMFDVNRTAREVLAVYRHILNGDARPEEFDSRRVAEALMQTQNSKATKASEFERELQNQEEMAAWPR